MELTPIEQTIPLLRQSTTPLILLPTAPSTDALAAGLALTVALERQGKAIKIVSPNFSLPANHDFLPKSDAVEQRLTSLRNFVISVDLQRTKLDSLSYAVQDNHLHIYLAPKQGFYESKDVTTSAGKFAHDLIIVLDCPSLDTLGPLYHDNAEFFYQVPVINIDHHPTNTRYGHTNLIDVVASSVSEIVFELLKAVHSEAIDEQVATSILTGIISKTKMFQNQRVTPKSLAIASHLMSSGARREDIIQHLYQTKTLSTLQLWGRALGRLQSAKQGRVVWTYIDHDDFKATGAQPADATGVLDELMTETAAAEVTALFVAEQGHTAAHLVLPTPSTHPVPTEFRQRGPEYFVATIPGHPRDVAARIMAQLGA